MALTHYLCQVDNALDPRGPLSQAIPHVVIGEVNTAVELPATGEIKRPVPLVDCDGEGTSS